MNNYNIVGFSGGTASGKTTIVSKLFNHYGKTKSVIIGQDSYYKDHNLLSYQQRSKINYDHPNAIDFMLMKKHLTGLSKGKQIAMPEYDFSTHTRTNKTRLLVKPKIIILEGIFALYQLDILLRSTHPLLLYYTIYILLFLQSQFQIHG